MPSAKQHRLHLSGKLLQQVKIIDSYKVRIAELDAEYSTEIIRLAVVKQLEKHK
jgi:hypothetical protein